MTCITSSLQTFAYQDTFFPTSNTDLSFPPSPLLESVTDPPLRPTLFHWGHLARVRAKLFRPRCYSAKLAPSKLIYRLHQGVFWKVLIFLFRLPLKSLHNAPHNHTSGKRTLRPVNKNYRKSERLPMSVMKVLTEKKKTGSNYNRLTFFSDMIN